MMTKPLALIIGGIILAILPFLAGYAENAAGLWISIIVGAILILLGAGMIIKMMKMMQMMKSGKMDMSKVGQDMMNQMVASVAALPDEQRKTMMKERMAMIMEMPDAQKKMQALKMMNRALHNLSDDKLEKMLESRLELLYEMSSMMKKKALMIIEANKEILTQIPKKDMMREAEITKKLIQLLSGEKRSTIESLMREAKCTVCLVNP